MSVDTEIQGTPGSIEGAAVWLRTKLAVQVGAAADQMNASRRSADASWNCTAGEEFSGCMKKGHDRVNDLEKAATTMADDLDDFASKLRRCQSEMSDIRADARGAGLSVTDFLVQDPGPGPARPRDGFTGTPPEVEEHNRQVAAYDAHQDLIRAYNHASSEAARIDRQYSTACQNLQDDYSVGQHASWLVSTADVLGSGAEAAIGVQIGLRSSKLNAGAQRLLEEAKRAIDDLQAHPERYLKRKWFFFKTLDQNKLQADRLALEGKLDEAERLVKQGRALEGAKFPRVVKGAGKILGPLGLALGVYNDYQEGESTTQIAVSQGVSTAAGIGAGMLASAGTGALVGATIGSVIPGAGTVVGAVVGTAIGAGIAIFSDGAIDSLFENGPDVGKAWDAGVDSLKDTGDAIKDGVSGAVDTVGGWFD